MTKKPKAKQQKPRTQSIKKPYTHPHLVEYGNVAKLTASGGSVPPVDSMAAMV